MKKLSIFLFLVLLTAVACKNKTAPSSTSEATKTNDSNKVKTLTDTEKETYIAKGKTIAKASFVGLSSKLKVAMKTGGPQKAVKFCNAQASVIVDSLMKANNASIRRTTDKLRSQANKPTDSETAQLMAYKNQIAENHPLKPVVMPIDGDKIQFFAPIKMKAVCLKCHGTVGETMKEADYEVIKKLYPDDLATGYKEGEFRGVWSIQFDK